MTAWRANPAPGIFLGNAYADFIYCGCRRNDSCRLCRARAGLHSGTDGDRDFHSWDTTCLRGYPACRHQGGHPRSDVDEFAHPHFHSDAFPDSDRFKHADSNQHSHGHTHSDTDEHADAKANFNPLSYPIREYHAN